MYNIDVVSKKGKIKMDTDSLGNRMKSYEALDTSRSLMPNTPIYARIDGRAFHTFCRGLAKPFSTQFIKVMQDVTRRLVKDYNAILGYVESDEISLGWADSTKAPFEGRVQKLESVLSSAASAYFACDVLTHEYAFPELKHRMESFIPVFDCRIFNVPNMEELANAFLWRENDAIKNSITGMALNFFSDREILGKSGDEKIHMMRMKGYCFYEDTLPAFMRGTFYRRQVFDKVLTTEELDRIPKDKWPKPNENGEYTVVRSDVKELHVPYRLTDIGNKTAFLFNNEPIAILNKENPTFKV